ncbi:MAG: GNAT family N-acetyltransferase [Geitlerinemataceae cyanobacterium]
MTPSSPNSNLEIRSIQYRDLDAIDNLLADGFTAANPSSSLSIDPHAEQIRQCFGVLKFLSWFPNPYHNFFRAYIAHRDRQLQGFIQVSPFNRTASTWRVDCVGADRSAGSQDTGTTLLRYCLEAIWEARTWILEVEINNKTAVGLYRLNGFQPLAEMTYWDICAQRLQELAEREPNLPNLMPVSNADAQLLYQLDTVAMPPQIRQVFDRHISDFKTSLVGSVVAGIKQWFDRTETVSGYVFEPQRKAAIGYFQLQLSRHGTFPHKAQLSVHPAYTWLYPELLAQMARITRDFPSQSLQLASADYQPEREEYLIQVNAEPIQRTLLMSRSVWHKLREAKHAPLELQLSEVLSGLQPRHKPVPGRMMWWQSVDPSASEQPGGDRKNGHQSGEKDPKGE